MDCIYYIIQRKVLWIPILFLGSAAALKLRLKILCGHCKSNRRMDGKTIIVTGANTGIGRETAENLARRGAKVILACRNMKKAQEVVKHITKQTHNKHVYTLELNLCSFDSIRNFVTEFITKEDSLDVLINNAGVFGPHQKSLTEDGLETTFQTNHFGPFLLTLLLLPVLKASKPARIINVSSKIHIRMKKIDFDHFKGEIQASPYTLYSETKLCNILFTRYLAEQLRDTGVTVNALHPGIVRTELARNVSGWRKYGLWLIGLFILPFLKSPLEGAQTSIYLAVDPKLEKISGEYFGDCRISKSSSLLSRDMGLAKKLWEVSEHITGISIN